MRFEPKIGIFIVQLIGYNQSTKHFLQQQKKNTEINVCSIGKQNLSVTI